MEIKIFVPVVEVVVVGSECMPVVVSLGEIVVAIIVELAISVMEVVVEVGIPLDGKLEGSQSDFSCEFL